MAEENPRAAHGPGFVMPWLAIGTAAHACDTALLHELGFTHVLRCISGPVRSGDDIVEELIPLCDYGTTPLDDRAEEAVPFLDDVAIAADQGAKVLVHCQAGINRSPAMTVAYFMRSEMFKMPLREAFDLVSKGRPGMLIHDSYVDQLREMDRELFGQHSTAEGELMCTSKMMAQVRSQLGVKEQPDGDEDGEDEA